MYLPAAQVHELVEKAGVVKEDWNGYNILHDAASRVAALDLGFLPSARAQSAVKPKFVYLLGSDDYAEGDVPEDAFVVYQVHWCSVLLLAAVHRRFREFCGSRHACQQWFAC